MKLRSPSNSSAPQNVARPQSVSRDNSESDIAENSPYGSFAFTSISIHAEVVANPGTLDKLEEALR